MNLRPLAPHASALPDCATPRYHYLINFQEEAITALLNINVSPLFVKREASPLLSLPGCFLGFIVVECKQYARMPDKAIFFGICQIYSFEFFLKHENIRSLILAMFASKT